MKPHVHITSNKNDTVLQIDSREDIDLVVKMLNKILDDENSENEKSLIAQQAFLAKLEEA